MTEKRRKYTIQGGGGVHPSNVLSALQLGRTITEMMGVLAIIGLLSLTALFGYEMAMTYYKANETIHDVMLRASNVPMKWENYLTIYDKKYEFPELTDKNSVGYGVEVFAEPEQSYFAYRVEVTGMPNEVCRRIISMEPTDVSLYTAFVAGEQPAGLGRDKTENAAATDCGKSESNMYFFFDEAQVELFECSCPLLGEQPEGYEKCKYSHPCKDGTVLEECEQWCFSCDENHITCQTGDKEWCCPDTQQCGTEVGACILNCDEEQEKKCSDGQGNEWCCPDFVECGYNVGECICSEQCKGNTCTTSCCDVAEDYTVCTGTEFEQICSGELRSTDCGGPCMGCNTSVSPASCGVDPNCVSFERLGWEIEDSYSCPNGMVYSQGLCFDCPNFDVQENADGSFELVCTCFEDETEWNPETRACECIGDAELLKTNGVYYSRETSYCHCADGSYWTGEECTCGDAALNTGDNICRCWNYNTDSATDSSYVRYIEGKCYCGYEEFLEYDENGEAVYDWVKTADWSGTQCICNSTGTEWNSETKRCDCMNASDLDYIRYDDQSGLCYCGIEKWNDSTQRNEWVKNGIWDGSSCDCGEIAKWDESNKECKCWDFREGSFADTSFVYYENGSCLCGYQEYDEEAGIYTWKKVTYWDGQTCVCPEGQVWYDDQCQQCEGEVRYTDSYGAYCYCGDNAIWNPESGKCECTDSTLHYFGGQCTSCGSGGHWAIILDSSTGQRTEECRCDSSQAYWQDFSTGCVECPSGTEVNQALKACIKECSCVEIQLNSCANGEPAFKICCDPENGDCDALGCMEESFWREKDVSGQCSSIGEFEPGFSGYTPCSMDAPLCSRPKWTFVSSDSAMLELIPLCDEDTQECVWGACCPKERVVSNAGTKKCCEEINNCISYDEDCNCAVCSYEYDGKNYDVKNNDTTCEGLCGNECENGCDCAGCQKCYLGRCVWYNYGVTCNPGECLADGYCRNAAGATWWGGLAEGEECSVDTAITADIQWFPDDPCRDSD